MAQYINYVQGGGNISFDDYWNTKYNGKAESREAIDFWSNPNLEYEWKIWMLKV